MVRDVNGGVIGQIQRTRLTMQAQRAVGCCRVGVNSVCNVLVDFQGFIAHPLVRCFGRMNIEDEISAVAVNVVLQVDLQLEPHTGVSFC